MIVWINGTFGAGKSSVARQLVPLLPRARVYDPETVGDLLRHVLTEPVDDSQDWPPWRQLVVETAAEVHRYVGGILVTPMTVLRTTTSSRSSTACPATAWRSGTSWCTPARTSSPVAWGSAPTGALPEPAKGRRAGGEDRDVAVVWAEPELGRAGMAREPSAVRAGRDPVLAPVQEQGRRPYLPGVEPPRGDIGQVVIHHPAQAALQGLFGDIAQPGPRTGEGGPICRGELLRVERGGGQMVGRPRKQGFGRRAEVRGAVVPEHHQAGVSLTGRGVIDMQGAPVAQHEIGLGHQRSSIPSDRDRADTPVRVA